MNTSFRVYEFTFNKIENASLSTEWCFFLMGFVFCFISIFGNGYVSYRLVKIVRVSKAIQTPIYLSLTICGFCTGVFCMPYMLYTFYIHRIDIIDKLSFPDQEQTMDLVTTVPSTSSSSYNFTTYLYSTTLAAHQNSVDCGGKISEMSMLDRVMCNMAGTVFNVTSRLIVWLMLLLSVDRYIFICKPYRIHLVKKQHYVVWIGICCAIVTLLSFAPYVFYHPEADTRKPAHCPRLPYQPYKPTYTSSYVCDYSPLSLLNISVLKKFKFNSTEESDFTSAIVFFFFTVVLFLLVPIFLNVILSFKVLFEILKMRKVTRMTSVSVARGHYTYVTKCETIELDEIQISCPNTCPPNLYQFSTCSHGNCNHGNCTLSEKRKSLPLAVSQKVVRKVQDFLKWTRHGSVIENKASFTMLVLSLFYVVTYFAWVVVWCSTIQIIENLKRSYYANQDQMWIFIYHSNSSFAYNIISHYPQATFANAAFVPCLLGYSLHRGKS